MIIYIPAIISLVLKATLILFFRKQLLKSTLNKTLLGLLIATTISNCLEILAYTYSDISGEHAVLTEDLLRCYYLTLVLLFALTLQITMLIGDRKINIWYGIANCSASSMMAFAILFTDAIVAGAESIGYTVTRVPGEYYWIFQLYTLGILSVTLSVSIYSYKFVESYIKSIQTVYLVMSVGFLFSPILIAIVMMSVGIKMSAAVILPIGISFFTVTLTYALNAKKLYDIRVLIPGTIMFKIHLSLQKEFLMDTNGCDMTAKERRGLHEERYISQALIKAKGNQTLAAQMLNVSPSTLSLKKKLYNITEY